MGSSLQDVVAAIERIAPPALADDWDNVGLLVGDPDGGGDLDRCLLTIDLSEAVLDEAIEQGHRLIVAYHPPIFQKLRRLRSSVAGERILLKAIRAGIAIHSPHTALDAAVGGVNDWLADGLGEGSRRSLVPVPGRSRRQLVARVGATGAAAIVRAVEPFVDVESGPSESGGRLVRCVLDPAAEEALATLPDEVRARCEVRDVVPPSGSNHGQGRGVELAEPRPLEVLIDRIKQHLGLERVRLACTEAHRGGEPIRDVLLCAGAGGSVLAPRPADLYWTGEMRHHDVLAALTRGTSVVLCEHSNTERGYLPTFKERILAELDGGIDVRIAQADREPLEIV